MAGHEWYTFPTHSPVSNVRQRMAMWVPWTNMLNLNTINSVGLCRDKNGSMSDVPLFHSAGLTSKAQSTDIGAGSTEFGYAIAVWYRSRKRIRWVQTFFDDSITVKRPFYWVMLIAWLGEVKEIRHTDQVGGKPWRSLVRMPMKTSETYQNEL